MISASQVTVGDTATLLSENTGNIEEHVTVRNDDGANPIWLGPSDVATTTGLKLPIGETTEVTLWPGDALYGIAGNTLTATTHVLVVRGSP